MLRLNALKSQNFKTKFKFYLSDLANDSEESTNLMNNFSKIGLHTSLKENCFKCFSFLQLFNYIKIKFITCNTIFQVKIKKYIKNLK